MKSRWYFFGAVLTAVIIMTAVIAFIRFGKNEPSKVSFTEKFSENVRTPRLLTPLNADRFLDRVRFQQTRMVLPNAIEGNVVAGVVNHHVLASDLMRRFFKTLGHSRPDITRVIILSPDHYEQGRASISIGMTDYVTQSQKITVDRLAAERLVISGSALGEQRIFENEHGIGALIPFLAEELPLASIVPIVIRADISSQEIFDFGQRLASIIDDQTVIVISSDMSHYLPEASALKNDEQTLGWLYARDRLSFERATDDYTDNGPALAVLFSMFEKMKRTPTFQLIDHTISTKYGADRLRTTSYITGMW